MTLPLMLRKEHPPPDDINPFRCLRSSSPRQVCAGLSHRMSPHLIMARVPMSTRGRFRAMYVGHCLGGPSKPATPWAPPRWTKEETEVPSGWGDLPKLAHIINSCKPQHWLGCGKLPILVAAVNWLLPDGTVRAINTMPAGWRSTPGT